MSDYEHNKALRYRLTKQDLERFEEEATSEDPFWNAWHNIWQYIEDEVLPEINNGANGHQCRFAIGYGYSWKDSESHYYLDYILLSSYGEEGGEWSRARYLTENEENKYREIFEKVIPGIDMSRVHLVDYCYYNACDPNDCYDVEEDEFNKEV